MEEEEVNKAPEKMPAEMHKVLRLSVERFFPP